MSHFVSEGLTRLDLGNGEWIDIKPKLSVGDFEKIAADGRGETPETRIVAVLLTVIKAWNLKDDNKEMPINRQSIERLEQDIALQIITQVGEHNQLKKV